MVAKESRPVFQLSASLGCQWKNIERAHEQTVTAEADLLALLQREVGDKFASEDANLVVFGSLGRGEWIDWLSDLDWTLLVDGLCKPGHFQIAQDIREALKKVYRPTATGKVEAKWEAERLAEDKLLVFRGKIEGKSSFTRGVFVSISGFSPECLQSISKHKQPTFFLLDGYDLTTVLEGQVTLTDVLRAKRIRLAEEGTLLYRVQKR